MVDKDLSSSSNENVSRKTFLAKKMFFSTEMFHFVFSSDFSYLNKRLIDLVYSYTMLFMIAAAVLRYTKLMDWNAA